MKRLKVTVPLFVPEAMYRPLRTLKHRLFPVPAFDLSGERQVEYSFCAASMPAGPGEALEFGCGDSYMGLLAARRGFRVTAIDLMAVEWPYRHPALQFTQGDLFTLPLGKQRFDLIINSSSVEHVGLAGRYGVTDRQPDGDLEAMARLRALMKPTGLMILSLPVGRDNVFAPWHRVYGEQRLPRLVAGYAVEHEEYWVKDDANRWQPGSRESALSFPARASADGRWNVYALGCFLLHPAPADRW